MSREWLEAGYLLAAVSFILALKLMNSPVTARRGNWVAALGMTVALVVTFFQIDETWPNNFLSPRLLIGNLNWIIGTIIVGTLIGYVSARRVPMTAMPQMVALLNGLGGGAVATVALMEFLEHSHRGISFESLPLATAVLSAVIGSISFTGSLIAFGKLQELIPSKAVTYPGQRVVNLALLVLLLALVISILVLRTVEPLPYIGLVLTALALGILTVVPIGGADMPVVIALLNSFTGTAAGLAGFVLMNTALLIGGGLVGASGLILTLLMCRAMNRSLENVLFGAFGATGATAALESASQKAVRNYSVEDAAIMLSNADSVVIVPGYGMAVAQAQHQVKELADNLQKRGVDIKYAIHPVAGRMPGHMNVLLAEADVPYDQLYELESINPMFPETDVVLVIGANDVVNPAARHDKASPIYGMPILDVDKARTVIVFKRSMNPGFAGIENELFYEPNTVMVFGNAKTTIAKLTQALEAY